MANRTLRDLIIYRSWRRALKEQGHSTEGPHALGRITFAQFRQSLNEFETMGLPNWVDSDKVKKWFIKNWFEVVKILIQIMILMDDWGNHRAK